MQQSASSTLDKTDTLLSFCTCEQSSAIATCRVWESDGVSVDTIDSVVPLGGWKLSCLVQTLLTSGQTEPTPLPLLDTGWTSHER